MTLPPNQLIPDDDAQRLEALGRYRQLSTQGEEVFNDLVRLTAKLFGAPIALVSLVEQDAVVFAGNEGLPGAEQVPRGDSLCSVAILQEETTVFENLAEEPCSLINPFVARALNLHFYAGHALRTPDGYAIGSLCVIDRRARTFSSEERALLTFLSVVMMRMLELRATLAKDAALAPALWNGIYARIMPSLVRINTLLELSSWEDTPDTPTAISYRQSHYDEANLVVRALLEEMDAALARLQ